MAVRKKLVKPTKEKKEEVKIEPIVVQNAVAEVSEAVKVDSAVKEPVSPAPENNPLDNSKENVVAESMVKGNTVNLPPENSPQNNLEEKAETEPVTSVPVSPAPENNPLNDFKEKVEIEMNLPSRPQKNYMWPILFIFIIALALLGGIFVYRQGIFKVEKVNVVSLSPTPIVSPVPTKAVDLKKYEIEILNGSEAAGEASRQKTILETAGFTISSIGNADNSDYTDTIVKAKAEVDKNFLAKLKSDLENTFTVGETQILSEDSSVPVVVILGTKK